MSSQEVALVGSKDIVWTENHHMNEKIALGILETFSLQRLQNIPVDLSPELIDTIDASVHDARQLLYIVYGLGKKQISESIGTEPSDLLHLAVQQDNPIFASVALLSCSMTDYVDLVSKTVDVCALLTLAMTRSLPDYIQLWSLLSAFRMTCLGVLPLEANAIIATATVQLAQQLNPEMRQLALYMMNCDRISGDDMNFWIGRITMGIAETISVKTASDYITLAKMSTESLFNSYRYQIKSSAFATNVLDVTKTLINTLIAAKVEGAQALANLAQDPRIVNTTKGVLQLAQDVAKLTLLTAQAGSQKGIELSGRVLPFVKMALSWGASKSYKFGSQLTGEAVQRANLLLIASGNLLMKPIRRDHALGVATANVIHEKVLESFGCQTSPQTPINVQTQTLTPVSPNHIQTQTLTPVSPKHIQTQTLTPVSPLHVQTQTLTPASPKHIQTQTLTPVRPTHIQTQTLTPVRPTHVQTQTLTPVRPTHVQTQTLTPSLPTPPTSPVSTCPLITPAQIQKEILVKYVKILDPSVAPVSNPTEFKCPPCKPCRRKHTSRKHTSRKHTSRRRRTATRKSKSRRRTATRKSKSRRRTKSIRWRCTVRNSKK